MVKETVAHSAGEAHAYTELGQVVRRLHESLRELGGDTALQSVVGELPDTRDRLNYIITLTEQAANRTLAAVESAMPMQAALATEASALAEAWRSGAADEELRGRVQDFLDAVPARSLMISKLLTEVMMAQDFQDLTGQVIKKVMNLAQEMEHQLVNVLLIARPEGDDKPGSLENGPALKAGNETLAGQQEVDDLLDSLGF